MILFSVRRFVYAFLLFPIWIRCLQRILYMHILLLLLSLVLVSFLFETISKISIPFIILSGDDRSNRSPTHLLYGENVFYNRIQSVYGSRQNDALWWQSICIHVTPHNIVINKLNGCSSELKLIFMFTDTCRLSFHFNFFMRVVIFFLRWSSEEMW